jgi:hypothetical protein
MRKLHTIPFNPSTAVELPPETRQPVKVRAPEQVGHFLEHHKGDRLYFMWRLALLRGFRRGERRPSPGRQPSRLGTAEEPGG